MDMLVSSATAALTSTVIDCIDNTFREISIFNFLNNTYMISIDIE